MPQYLITYDQGNSPGPFNIYLTGSNGPASLYASNVTRGQLEAGYVVTFDDSIPSSSVLVDNMAYGCATEEVLPFPTRTPSITPSISRTPSVTPSISLTPTVTPTVTLTPTTTPSITPTITLTPSVTPSFTPSTTLNSSASPTPSVTPTITITRTPSTTPPTVSYFWLGTTGTYDTGFAACSNRNCNAQYYTAEPFGPFGVNDIVYTNSGLTTPFNGNGKWIAINYNCVGAWAVIQVASNGVVLQTYAC